MKPAARSNPARSFATLCLALAAFLPTRAAALTGRYSTRTGVWHQSHIARGDIGNGPWAIEVERTGSYAITLQCWAPYLTVELLD